MFLIVAFASCSNETDLTLSKTQNSNSYKTYSDLLSLPSKSLLNSGNGNGVNTRSNEVQYPAISKNDANILLNMSQCELENVMDSLINLAGGMQVIDSIQTDNYLSTFNKVGGKEGVGALIDFSTQYLTMKPGWESVEQIIPNDVLNGPMGQQYAEQAAYLDRVARPISELLISSKWEHDISICKMQLAVDLAYTGVSVSTDAFLDAMSGGVETPELILQLISAGVNVYETYRNYEECNGRWH